MSELSKMATEAGPTERAYRRWLHTLGRLNEHQLAQAEAICVMAAQLDAAARAGKRDNTISSAVAAVSRELRMATATLRNVLRLDVPVNTPTDSVDEVGRQRAERLHRFRKHA